MTRSMKGCGARVSGPAERVPGVHLIVLWENEPEAPE